ncbi:MAG TPA: hypothetical protein VF062_25410 [Candidatus Limnocylindrales bacterium]
MARRTLTEPPLHERDPKAWNALLAEGNRTQPRKRVGAGVLLRDEAGRWSSSAEEQAAIRVGGEDLASALSPRRWQR